MTGWISVSNTAILARCLLPLAVVFITSKLISKLGETVAYLEEQHQTSMIAWHSLF